MTPESILFALLRAAVCGEQVTEKVKAACTPEALEQVYILAVKHDLVHLPGHVLGNLGVPDCLPMRAMKQAAFGAVQRCLRLEYELGQICNAFEQAQIPYIPLKGAVIRKLYPEPWMRTSCDIDVLIHEENLERAAEVLVTGLSYRTDYKKAYHDMSLFSPSGIHLELHFSIQETMENIDGLLSKVWEHAVPVTGYQYALEKEFLAFHLLAHMSYHFVGGGCGIRALMDIFLLRERKLYDERVLRGYLSQCGIERFYDSILELISVWFRGSTPAPLAERMEQYLLTGGTYGTQEQRIAVRQQREGGRLGYLLGRIFMPYRNLKIRYRVLEQYPILFPVFQVYRWIELLFGGRMKRSIREAKITMQTENDVSKQVNEFLRQIGL